MLPLHRLAASLVPALLLCTSVSVARAQDSARVADSLLVARSCDGRIVSAFDLRPGRPPFSGVGKKWRAAARAVGLHHATTRPNVLQSFMALHVGQPCTELRRMESERILRAQPFLADALVHVVPDGRGGVRAVVETVDEVPVLIGARFHGLSPEQLSIGNSNIGGRGLSVEVSGERGFAYSNGYGVDVRKYSLFGHPYLATLNAQHYTLGHLLEASLEHPFYADVQKIGWHLGIHSSDEYPRLRRPARDELALEVSEERWDASSLTRVFGASTVWLVGIGASGLRLTPGSAGVIVSDSGLVADTGVTLLNRYKPFRSGRLGGIGSLRHVTFRSVRGFDGLSAQQDVANGVMAGLFVAKGLPSLGESDVFASSAVYGGWSGTNSMLMMLGQWEARRAQGGSSWDSGVGSGRGEFYFGVPGSVLVIRDRYAAAARSLLPAQFWIGDRQGGILGYHNSSLAGSRRNAVHAEWRVSRTSVVRGADLGLAPFVQVGSVWHGDAPYGVTATRSTLGLSILAAYPTRSKRLYRADVGFPLSGGRGAGIELRFTSEDRATEFWREPDDVMRARTGSVPVSLFAWQTR